MPHCLLEYSTNIADSPDFKKLFLELHEALAATGEFSISDFKSRAVGYDTFQVADGDENDAFIALELSILDGRSDQTKATLSSITLDILKRYFPQTQSRLKCNLTVRISDIHRPSYTKFHK